MNFWTDSVLITCLAAWFIAQLIKVLTNIVQNKKFDFRRFIGSGGMPSSHTAFVTSLAAAVGWEKGFAGTEFAISAVFSLVVMYDAAGVRRAAGQQAKILNEIVDEWGRGSFANSEKRLKELLGHTPKEVFAGAVLGVAVAAIRHFCL